MGAVQRLMGEGFAAAGGSVEGVKAASEINEQPFGHEETIHEGTNSYSPQEGTIARAISLPYLIPIGYVRQYIYIYIFINVRFVNSNNIFS